MVPAIPTAFSLMAIAASCGYTMSVCCSRPPKRRAPGRLAPTPTLHLTLPAGSNAKSPAASSEAVIKGDLEDRWLRGLDLNQRPSGYEPDELPDCSTPRHLSGVNRQRRHPSARLSSLSATSCLRCGRPCGLAKPELRRPGIANGIPTARDAKRAAPDGLAL